MGPGCAGATSKMFNVNVNQIQFGDKLQGLPPVTGRKIPYKSIRAKEGGNLPNRERIYCINQLGSIGMGNKNSQFAANADGVGPCPNRKNRRGYHGLHRKHHHPTEKHPNRGVSRATEHGDFNTSNLFFGNFITDQSGSNIGAGANDGCWDLGEGKQACCPEGYEPFGNGSACQKKDDPSQQCSLNESNLPALNCCGRPAEGSNGTWPLPCTDKRCWNLGGDKWACCPEGYEPFGNGSACQKKDDLSQKCSLNESNVPALNCCGPAQEEWASPPDCEQPTPQSEFLLGTCATEISPGFGINLAINGKAERGTFTTFGFEPELEIGVKKGNYLKFMDNPVNGRVIQTTVAMPATWLNESLINMYGDVFIAGNNGHCSNGPVWSKGDPPGVPDVPINKTVDGVEIMSHGGAIVVDAATGEPWIFKLWYVDSRYSSDDVPELGDNYILVIVGDLCGGDANAGFQGNKFWKPGEADFRIDAQISYVDTVDPPGTGGGCVFAKNSPQCPYCESRGYLVNFPNQCRSNLDNIGKPDQGTDTSSLTPQTADEAYNKERISNPLIEIFGAEWKSHENWRMPPAQICSDAYGESAGIEEIYANSDFRTADITRDALISQYCEGGKTGSNPAGNVNKSYDNCSGRFFALDIRLGSSDAISTLYNIWETPGVSSDSGQILFQRISFKTLKGLIGDNAVGKAQLENILARCTYKDFGTNNKLD
ncbi:MAG: hypothetical protein ACXABD_00445 [Candidatus Thorarchaeota archaeon]